MSASGFASKTPSRKTLPSYKSRESLQSAQASRSIRNANAPVQTLSATNVTPRSFPSNSIPNVASVAYASTAAFPTTAETSNEYDELRQKAEAYEKVSGFAFKSQYLFLTYV